MDIRVSKKINQFYLVKEYIKLLLEILKKAHERLNWFFGSKISKTALESETKLSVYGNFMTEPITKIRASVAS